MFIYVIRNVATGREYVGKTVRPIRARFMEHLATAKRGRRSPLCDALRAEGGAGFALTLLAAATTHASLCDLERRFVEERHTLMPHGYNQVRGGLGNYGWTMPDVTRKKIAAKATGRRAWNKGLPMRPDLVAKMSAARKGQPLTEAQKLARRTQMTSEVRAKIRATKLSQGFTGDRNKWSQVALRNHASMSSESKAVRNEKVAQAKRAWWASLSENARAEYIQKMSRGHVAA